MERAASSTYSRIPNSDITWQFTFFTAHTFQAWRLGTRVSYWKLLRSVGEEPLKADTVNWSYTMGMPVTNNTVQHDCTARNLRYSKQNRTHGLMDVCSAPSEVLTANTMEVDLFSALRCRVASYTGEKVSEESAASIFNAEDSLFHHFRV